MTVSTPSLPSMVVHESVEPMRAWSDEAHRLGESIAFVPTMGFLHAGHLSLVAEARQRGDRVVASIYVNPTQFAEGEDLDVYPRDLEGDLEKLQAAGCDAVFAPTDLYVRQGSGEPPHETYVEVTELQKPLCGASRPIFFRGVATIVTKLFNIVRPDVAVFGRKDYQQWRLLHRMARDLDMGIEVVGMPIIREADGLAMSSRNALLEPQHRRKAPAIFRALSEAVATVAAGDVDGRKILATIVNRIEGAGGVIDYVTLSDALTLHQVQTIDRPCVVAVAALFGAVRLIDNIELTPPAQ